MSSPDLPRAADLPDWMRQLRDRFLQTETSQFILYGNVHDAVMCAGQVWNMPSFLDAFFAPSNKLVVHYDPGRGIWFPDTDHGARAALSLVASGFVSAAKVAPRGVEKTPRTVMARNLADQLGAERQPEIALEALEALLLDQDVPTAVVLHYAELIAPDGSPSTMSFFDRTAAARLHRWSLSDEILRGNNLVLMLTGALSDLARRVTRNPRVGALHVPLPGALARARFLAHIRRGIDPDEGERLTRITAGLQLRQIQDLVAPKGAKSDPVAAPSDARAVFSKAAEPIPAALIAKRKKEILEQECYGLIEVIEPDHDFSHVGGMGPIKRTLQRIAGHVHAGRTKQVPMGILFVGPMGTGKSFLAEAFARESGLAAVKLKNFRDKWVGSTEANLEKVLDVIEGLGEILVMIDEGDRSIGGAGDGGDSGVNSRVIARLKEFMSDPTHRGRIIFVMMTNRPDKLDTDMKRPGRFDMKIPFFSPQNSEERAAIVRAVLRRHRIEANLPDEALMPLLDDLDGYAAADLEAVVLLAYDDLQSGDVPPEAPPSEDAADDEATDGDAADAPAEAAPTADGVADGPLVLTAPYLRRAVADFMPTRETAMIRYMELLAVHEASNRRLLPPALRDIQVEELNARLSDARATLARQKATV